MGDRTQNILAILQQYRNIIEMLQCCCDVTEIFCVGWENELRINPANTNVTTTHVLCYSYIVEWEIVILMLYHF